MDGLRLKLESQGLKDVAYVVVNQQGEQAGRLHPMLAQRLSVNINLYKQDEQQPDVWKTLGGEKDDFLVYDRCGRLTHHIALPYSIIGHGHVESAIKDAYCKRTCGDCVHESATTPEECVEKAVAQPDADVPPVVEDNGERGGHRGHHHQGHGHEHHRGRHHGHHHGHHHGDQGDGQQAVVHHGHVGHGGASHRQHNSALDQMQQEAHIPQMPRGAEAAPVRP